MKSLRRLKRKLDAVLFLLFCTVIVAGGLYLAFEVLRWFIVFMIGAR